GGSAGEHDYRTKAADPKAGHLLYQWKEISGLKSHQPKEVTLELRYADAPKVKPGSTIELVSAWSDSSRSYWHVWGLTTNISGPVDKYKLPDAPKKTSRPARTTSTRARATSTRSSSSRSSSSRSSSSRSSSSRSSSSRSSSSRSSSSRSTASRSSSSRSSATTGTRSAGT